MSVRNVEEAFPSLFANLPKRDEVLEVGIFLQENAFWIFTGITVFICLLMMLTRRQKHRPSIRREQKETVDRDRYIGEHMNTGVTFDKEFLQKEQQVSFKDPASYTPYSQDYIRKVVRPKPKPFPTA